MYSPYWPCYGIGRCRRRRGGRNWRGIRRPPGTGGRGRGNMYRFYATGIPGWQLNYKFRESESDLEKRIEKVLSKLEKLLEKK